MAEPTYRELRERLDESFTIAVEAYAEHHFDAASLEFQRVMSNARALWLHCLGLAEAQVNGRNV